MQFWENLSPGIRKAVIAGGVLLLALLVARYFVSLPTVDQVAPHRGIK